MDAVAASELLHVLVLGKQGNRRDRLAVQHAFEEFGQREAGALDLRGRRFAARLRPLDELLHRRFHGAQDQRGGPQAHHLERADRLVQLLAGDAQLAVVDRGHVLAARQGRVAHEAPQGRRRGLERLAQLVEHPGQRAEVLGRQVDVGSCLHGAMAIDFAALGDR